MIKLFFKRLLKAIKHIPFFIKKSITYEFETCDRCGIGYRLLWKVDDKIWEKVFRKFDASGCYCPTCFIEIAENKNIIIKNEEIEIFPFYFK